MIKGVWVVAALAAGMFLDRGRVATAQIGTPQSENKPYFYLWAAPAPPGSWGNLSDRASQIVRVKTDFIQGIPGIPTPQQVAQKVQDDAVAQISSGATDEDAICILLQNFGQWSGGGNPTRLIRTEDAPPPPPLGWQNVPLWCPELPNLQPWMDDARPIVSQWMLDFLEAYDGPTPIRFHFDSEIKLSTCCDVNFTISLAQATQDSRWGSSDTDPGLAVPGSADYLVSSGGVDKQMWKLYEEAKQRFPDWPNKPLYIPGNPGGSALDITKGPNDPKNRRYFLWYWEICQRALDAAMNECAYSVIKSYPNYEHCQVSNYKAINADGKTDTFGWHTGREDTGLPLPTTTPSPASLEETRTSARGLTDLGNDGAWFMWSDLIEEDPATQQEIRRSLWITVPGVASGDFSSPVLYPPNPPHWYGGQAVFGDRLHYYLPKISGNWPKATIAETTLAYARRVVESIINSTNGSPFEIVPWIRPMGQEAKWDPHPQGWYPALQYTTTSADFRDMLAMLRAKRTPEIIIWWGDGGINPLVPDWPTMKAIMDHVYKPQLNQIRVLTGACTNCPTPPATPHVDRLRYTLREPTDANLEYVQVASSNVDPPQVALRLTFGGMDGWVGNVTLNFEGSVNLGELGSIEEMRGQVYVWNGHTWQLVPIDDYPGSADSGFGFFAPINPAGDPNAGWYETRRTWENIPKYVVNGNMDIKIVLQRTTSLHPFTSRFDLVQLVGQQDTNSPAEGQEQGADFNHTQTTESYDVAAFMSAYAAGAEAADFNNDGVVNADDLTAFSAAFAAGPP